MARPRQRGEQESPISGAQNDVTDRRLRILPNIWNLNRFALSDCGRDI